MDSIGLLDFGRDPGHPVAMSQGPVAPDFGVIAPSLADGVETHSGSSISISTAGAAQLGAKSSGSPLVIGLATVPRELGEAQPVRFMGPLTLTEDQWDAVTLRGGSTSSGGLVTGAVYVQWSSGKINEGNALMGAGDVKWVVGVALSSTTLLVNPRRHAEAN
jgi:hypothetical protein